LFAYRSGASHYEENIMTTVTGHTSAIRAKKVIGTSVKDPSGTSIGKVEDIVLDKLSNNIMFAIVGFGGFLGVGEKFHPLPWSVLDYDETEGGYVVNLTKEQLQSAPAYTMDELIRGDGSQFRVEVYDYYDAPRYW
jgi:sporulation protein YlmC with PRC-barrel domain